jgi:N,N'-diacetyllegionaminate synthase
LDTKEKMIQIIAEIGWNHGGDMVLAKKMILAAKESGGTYAKFQTWSVNRLKPGEWDRDGRRDIYKKAELTEERHLELINYCNKIGIEFLSSVFSIEDAMLLHKLGVKKVKIPSFESRNHELIKYCVDEFDVVFMSTGTSTVEEITSSINIVENASSKLVLMHCVSSYPCKPVMANLGKMRKLMHLHPNVGYSDHIEGVESAKVAIAEGAVVIEKHFTIDNNLPGRDNKFAILPDQLKNLSDYIKLREDMFIIQPDVQDSELDSRKHYTGRFNG